MDHTQEFAYTKDETHNRNGAVWLEERVEALEELESEEGHGLGAAGEDVVDNVVKPRVRVVGELTRVAYRVRNDGCVVGRQLEVL